MDRAGVTVTEATNRPGEIVSLEVWPLRGVGIGFIGERVQLLPVDAGAVIKAAMSISNISSRDTTASECALTLAAAGQREAARQTAMLISSMSLRDETLGKIAAGGNE